MKCRLCNDTREVIGLFAGLRVPCPECVCPVCGGEGGLHTYACKRAVGIALDAMKNVKR